MQSLWTWGGTFFGYHDGDELWTYQGRHVGRFDRDEVYGADGRYLGELRNDRLITNRSKLAWRRTATAPKRTPPAGAGKRKASTEYSWSRLCV